MTELNYRKKRMTLHIHSIFKNANVKSSDEVIPSGSPSKEDMISVSVPILENQTCSEVQSAI